jgi:chromosome partitioning protein
MLTAFLLRDNQMKTIVFAASKGGAGKTTLAWNTAFEAAKHGRTFLLDLDPQRSILRLSESRSAHVEAKDGDPALLDNGEGASISSVVTQLKRSGQAPDYLIADTPGSFMTVIMDAVEVADAIVIPIQPSPLDILAGEDLVLLAPLSGKLSRMLFVVNRVNGRAKIDDVIERMGELIVNPPVRVNERMSYKRSLIQGLTAPEYDPSTAAEVEALWTAIRTILDQGDAL